MRIVTWAAAIFLLPIAVIAGHMGISQLRGNFHEVIPGQLYRSGQLDEAQLDVVAHKYGIRTIINLRDEKHGDWYRQEQAAASQNNIRLVDYPLNAGRIVSNATATELAEIMRTAEKPILIHCEHGANRTGLASAIYVGAVAKRSELFSDWQLSPFYGHIPIPGIGRYAMSQSWDNFEETIGF
jgi:protein tyrosine/serine phosphatase